MADIFLIVSIVVASVILLVVGVYLIVYYQHPDDHNEAYFPKLVVLIGFFLAGATVLLLPLDVANNEGYAGCAGYDTALCGGLNMTLLWNIMFWAVPAWTFIMIPFATFYYESDDGMLMAGTAYAPNPVKQSRLGQALCYEMFVLVIVFLIFLVTYLTMSESNIPVVEYNGLGLSGTGLGAITTQDRMVRRVVARHGSDGELLNFTKNQLADMDSVDAAWLGTVVRNPETQTLTLTVGVATFYAGLMAFLGWFALAIFGGIGIAALPLDLILQYVHRPRHMDAVEFAEAQLSLRERVNELVDIGELLKLEREEKAAAGLQTNTFSTWSLDSDKRKAAKDERQAILGFKQAVFLMEQDVEDFQAVAENWQNYNPIWPYAAVLLGACALIITTFWLIHIIVYVFPDPPWAPFLNSYFAWFDKWFPLFGVLSIALFTVYLLFCAVKGCFKFGVRFLFFHIHPMRVGKTYMSSMMFNIALVLMCALPAVQFCQEAFADYAAFSEIRQIFGVQVQYLVFFGWFWQSNFFVYCLFVFCMLTCMYLACRPTDKAANGQALRDRLRSRKSPSESVTTSSGSAGGAAAAAAAAGASGNSGSGGRKGRG